MTTRSTQPIRTPTGLPYGEAGALEDAQRAAPLPDNRNAVGPAGPAGSGAPMVPVDVYGPTARPNEPVTAGAAVGPGPSSLEGLLPPVDDAVETLRALVMAGFGGPGLRRMLERAVQ